jgi:hypothetical protein
MEEKYKKFLEYDWQNSREWQLYYSNLFPTPPGNKILTFKKRFYKNKVDSEFDDKYVPPEPSTYQQPTYSQPNIQTTPQSPILGMIETIVWLVFLSTIITNYHSLKFAAFALLVRVIKRTGKPSFTINYAQLIFLDEHFQLMLYAILLLIDRFNYFTLLPIILTAVLNISEFIKSKGAMFRVLLPYANKVINKRVEIAEIRSNIEIGIGFLLVLGIIFGTNSFFLPIFYWQYLRFKYIVNEDTKRTFYNINRYVNILKNKPFVPSAAKYVITKLQDFFSYLGRTEAAPGQRAGGQNCSIF